MNLLLTHATIHTLDPVLGDLHDAGLLISGGTVADVGPHLAAGDDGVTVKDCSGLSIVPVAGLSTLAPGSPATFAVVRSDTRKAWEYVIWRPEHTELLVVDGRPGDLAAARSTADSPYLGMWIDESGYLHQELTADGRYDETRAGRRHAYQGDFWITGDRIVYHDDQGFWAYGEFRSDVLYHAGYVLRRA